MDRKEFLGKMGIGAAFVLTAGCLAGCHKKTLLGPPNHILEGNDKLPGLENVDITIDISDPKYSNLKWSGGWAIVETNIVVAKTEDTEEFVAASRLCSDEVLPGIVFAGNEWYCTEHDATFDTLGDGTQTHNDKGFRGLRVYQTELNNNLLRVFS